MMKHNLDANHDLKRLLKGTHHAPSTLLGIHSVQHDTSQGVRVRAFLPGAREAAVLDSESIPRPMLRASIPGVFEWLGPAAQIPGHPELIWQDTQGIERRGHLAHTFTPEFDESSLRAFSEGRSLQAYQWLGAHALTLDGIEGVHFVTWAPNALGVSVSGDFNAWHPSQSPMDNQGANGLWSLFIPGVAPGCLYKFVIHTATEDLMKADPYAREAEFRPGTASRIAAPSSHAWQDQDWLQRRHESDPNHAPLAIYEVHLGSWKHSAKGPLGYRDLVDALVGHVKRLGFTHIELLPIAEYPLDESWGYQTTGYYAPTSRYGSPDDLRFFIDTCHQQGIGVLLDWTPAHFPADAHALGRFDGTHLYEHSDPQQRLHPDWGTLIFNYGRNEVRSFLLSNAIYWLKEFHFDGLRVDAVASMLYLDYSRNPGEWTPNEYGGNENLPAMALLKQLNIDVHREFPGILMIAEESTAWPMVSRPVYLGGLGFGMKWNMGWMHDTLKYFAEDPVHRRYHHDQLTFGLLYAFHENFVLPLSHDEVVHGKGSLLHKMPGDAWQKMANLRLLYCYQYTFPGKKLLFMGSELAPEEEWRFNAPLPWRLEKSPPHRGIEMLLTDLNTCYVSHAPLHRYDFDPQGFEWIDCDDRVNSVLAYLRKNGNDYVVCVLNFTPVPRMNYSVRVPQGGIWKELLNSDADCYGGTNLGNSGHLEAITGNDSEHWEVKLTLPPLAAILLSPMNQQIALDAE